MSATFLLQKNFLIFRSICKIKHIFWASISSVLFGALFSTLLISLPIYSYAQELSENDRLFVNLSEASKKNDPSSTAQLAAQLNHHPLVDYVNYFQLKPKIYDTQGQAKLDAPDLEINHFLATYNGSALADRLRNDYLLVLGARRDWNRFRQEYPQFILNDDTQVKCYALSARLANNENVADEARELLNSPKQYGNGCVDLIADLVSKKQFNNNDVWQQMRLGYEYNTITSARKIADSLSFPIDKSLLIQTTAQPELFLQRKINDEIDQQLAVLALIRLSANALEKAAQYLEANQKFFTPQLRAYAWGILAYRAALSRSPNSLVWYSRANSAYANAYINFSPNVKIWQVRAALLAQNWPAVLSSIQILPVAIQNETVWQYWQASALTETGQTLVANQIFEKLSTGFEYYNLLAVEALHKHLSVPPHAHISHEKISQMEKNIGFQRAQYFYRLNLRFEGNREWNWQLRSMNDDDLLAAAHYAKQIDLLDRAVNTANRTQLKHDFKLRYPDPHRQILNTFVKETDLDIEWVYGLIRQESRFIINARSHAGASGLMQLMPGTANLVARKLGITQIARNQVNDINLNLRLGVAYLAMAYDEFEKSPVLASAAYNAGPNRARYWRTSLTQPIPGDIFAEIIPFNETRDYVQKVLANTVFYHLIYSNNKPSLRQLLGSISP